MKKVILFSLFSLLIFAGCEKSDVRDDYVGSWMLSQNGSVTLFQGSSQIGTVPVTNTQSVKISKYAVDELDIDGLKCQLSGSRLIFDSKTDTETSGTLIMQITTIRSGSVSGNIMTIKETYSGTWANGSQSGIVSGSSNISLTKL